MRDENGICQCPTCKYYREMWQNMTIDPKRCYATIFEPIKE